MNNKLVMIFGGVIVACFIAFGAMFFMMWSKINDLNARASSSTEPGAEEKATMRKMGPVYNMESFIVNLDDPKLRKYLRLTMDLELVDEKALTEIEQRLPQMRDAILTILPSKKYEEITTVAGKNALRAELLTAVNSFFEKEVITSVYFTEFVIQ